MENHPKARRRSVQVQKEGEAESTPVRKLRRKKQPKSEGRKPKTRLGKRESGRTPVKKTSGDESLKVAISEENQPGKDTDGKLPQSSAHEDSRLPATFVELPKTAKLTRAHLRAGAGTGTESDGDESQTTANRPLNSNNVSNSVRSTLYKHAIKRAFVLMIIICLMTLMTVAIYTWMFGGGPSYDRTVLYKNGLMKLQDRFKNQTDRLWRILKSRGLVHVKTRSPPKPMVVLLAAPPSAYHAMDCFSKNLAAILDPDYPEQLNVIDGKYYLDSASETAKEDLDQKLKVAFQSGHQVALIRELNLLPLPVALLFYSYCDNDNAPYKHVAMLFTVQLPGEVDPPLSSGAIDGIVEKFLSNNLWGNDTNHDANAVAALVSRISDSIVVVNAEDENKLKEVCNSF